MKMKPNMIVKYIGITCLLLALSITLTGCAGAGETKEEVARRHSDVVRKNMLLIQDDIDAILMLDKPSGASEKLVRP